MFYYSERKMIMTDKPLILAIKGDARQEYAVRALKRYFNTVQTQFPLSGTASADILLLPMLTKNGSFEGLSKHLKSGALILGGRIPPELKESFVSQGFEVEDYYDSEALKISNALPTAEGTLMIAMENTPRVISGSSVLITGFGACGRQIARLFSLLGAKVCIAARSTVARAEAQSLGYKTAELKNLVNLLPAADIVINTVPAHLFGRRELAAAKKETLFIEIASYPYGIDEGAALNLGRHLVKAPGLPAKCAPETGGEYIAQTVKEIITKRRESEP